MNVKQRKWYDRFGGILIEIFSVVLAVLLALAVNDWRDNRNARELTRQSIVSITEELRGNVQLVRDAHQHHEKVLDHIRSRFGDSVEISENDAKDFLLELYQMSIIKPGTVFETAWSTGQVSGALQGLDYNVALILAKVYTLQREYRVATETILNAMNLSQFLGTEASDYLSGVYEGVNSLWWHEKRLLESYNTALNAVEGLGHHAEERTEQ